jgi:DNA-binding protein HU-beta
MLPPPSLRQHMIFKEGKHMHTYTSKINKSDLITIVAHKAGVEKNIAEKIIETFLATIINELAHGHAIGLSGFGTFENRLYKKKKMKSNLNGKISILDERYIPKFNPSKNVKEKMNLKNQ